MAFGWALAAAYPAAAAGPAEPAGQVQPGGPVSSGQSQAAAPGTPDQAVSSSNWAGYAASGSNGAFTSASASWTQPAGQCTGGSTYAAFWVGLDGYTSHTVEQIGTEADCSGRTPQYYVWYEIYPGASVNFPTRSARATSSPVRSPPRQAARSSSSSRTSPRAGRRRPAPP
jgi:hypothetical protein